jgi:hypothetical protein
MVLGTDGRYLGATLDRNGSRPRTTTLPDDHVFSRRKWCHSDIADSDVKKIKHRLEPGKMFLVDFETQRSFPTTKLRTSRADESVLNGCKNGMIDLAAGYTTACRNPMDFSQTNRKLNMFGYSSENSEMLLLPMAVGGKRR